MSHVSEVAICNRALARLGEYRIDSLDEGSVASGLCKDNLPFARRKTLRRHLWNFAQKREILAQATEPLVEWAFAFTLPADLVRPIAFLNTNAERIDYFERQGDEVMSDEGWLQAVYIRDETDLTKWDDIALDVLSLELAKILAVPLTGSQSKYSMIVQELEQLAIDEARYIDAAEDRSAENNPVMDLIAASYINRSRRGYMGRRIRKGYDQPQEKKKVTTMVVSGTNDPMFDGVYYEAGTETVSGGFEFPVYTSTGRMEMPSLGSWRRIHHLGAPFDSYIIERYQDGIQQVPFWISNFAGVGTTPDDDNLEPWISSDSVEQPTVTASTGYL